MRTEPFEIASRAVTLLDAGRIGEARRLFAPAVRGRLSRSALRSAWAQHVTRHGGIVESRVVGTEVEDGHTLVRIECRTSGPILEATATVDADGGLLDLQVVPAMPPWQQPPYADPAQFEEAPITLGAGPLAVPGTLTIPRGSGQVPAVIMLSGGGPFDRDMTMGANRIGRDLAWGLATRGIATVRYDKPGHAHAAELAARTDLTAADEYLPFIESAITLLHDHHRIDASRIVLLGHSMGGKLAPRAALATNGIAGLVLLAADAVPMQHAAVRVVRYLATHDPQSGITHRDVRRMARKARLVDSRRLTARTPGSKLPFGYSGVYWSDLRGYDPVDAARRAELPMLLLQGGRDYQVTVDDDLARWHRGLDHRTDVTFVVLPEDDHLFFVGEGPSTPRGYEPPQHADPRVIDTVSEWIATSLTRPTSSDRL